MHGSEGRESEEVIGELLERVAERVPEEQAECARAFVACYYEGVAAEVLAERDLDDLYGAALAHWSLARERLRGSPKCHVYNPSVERHGWQCSHTVIEVVTDDMPFLVDSLRMAVNRRGLTCHLIIHPVLAVRRDRAGRLLGVAAAEGDDGEAREAVMHLEVDRQAGQPLLDALRDEVLRVLADVRVAVEDWRLIRQRLEAVIAGIDATPPPIPADELAEAKAFLEWIADDHFTFLAYREYRLVARGEDLALEQVPGSGLGLMRDGEAGPSQSFAALPAELRALAREPELLVITKAARRSTVHRPSHMDYIGVKRFDAEGRVCGEHRFLGLFTAVAYNRRPRAIPLLRRKEARVLERAGYPPNTHAGKALRQIIETFPRDLLFQIGDEELYEIAIGILQLHERERVRVFIHRDRFGRFYSCIVYVPRDRFNTEVRRAVQAILESSLGGSDAEFQVQLSDSGLARLFYVLRVAPGSRPDYDLRAIEAELARVTHTWGDDLREALLERCGEEAGTRLFRRYGEAFRAGYRDSYPPSVAVADLLRMEELDASGGDLVMNLYRPLEAGEHMVRLKLYRLGRPVSLSDVLPMLGNMGLRVEDEAPYKIKRSSGARVWIHDLGMTHTLGEDFDLDHVREKFEEAFARLWSGEIEDDGFNRLVLGARLGWREVVILRACSRYLRQLGVTFSQRYMAETLAANPHVARLLVALHHARLDPDGHDEARAEALIGEIRNALERVANLDQDRILRSFLGVIRAILRSNYYQRDADGNPKGHLTFKLDPARVPDMPEPRPMFEIFCYSPRVEGVHLRGGPVARGGLRWSDRREDFRTEVLGLVKAQMVKNAVIVPVGSKGGFVPKRLPAGDREAVLAEGIACYRTFIRGLLDLTDNLVGGEVVPPPRVVRHDGDDPYLVVAADKGTASFSDIANEVAAEYRFWLGDAFASGGSHGYDHKEMGITARGAWESVKRHFRERGLDTQTSEFTVVGIGDMSGDVFGNGMLMSRHIKLVGAFNHLHIFLDPDPDPERSFAERERLFALPRSSWADYDRTLISAGGGVWPRTAKSIPLSREARALLGVKAEALPPNELIRALLKAPVDLLWNGGIGTYVKARGERNAEVGDRANDAVRVNGQELRCRVVAEGGNLGFTQLGRIEFARAGGAIFTDAIDNSAGVDCSDHEVNIKILLNQVVAAEDMTFKQRNELLASMTDEVASLVLRNNYLQTQALAMAAAEAPAMLDVHARLIRRLERDGHLDRALEYLPSGEAIAERAAAGEGLALPELAVLLAYVKITLFQDLLASDLPEDPYLGAVLEGYFPTPLRVRFAPLMPRHRLAREIVSTVVANEVVNRAGTSFCFRLAEETGAGAAEVARAFLVAQAVFEMRALWTAIEALDNVVPARIQIRMFLEARKLVERAARWLLRNRPGPLPIEATIEAFRPGVETLTERLPEHLGEELRAPVETAAAELAAAGVPEGLAQRIALGNELLAVLDLVEVARAVERDTEEVAAAYFALGAALDLGWLRDQINALPRDNRWQALARAALRDDLYRQVRELTASVLRAARPGGDARRQVRAWLKGHAAPVGRCAQILADLKGGPRPDFAMLSVALRELRGLHQGVAPAPAAARSRRRRRAG